MKKTPNHTTFWIRIFEEEFTHPHNNEQTQHAINYLKQLNEYTYILILDKPSDIERIHVIIQYTSPVLINTREFHGFPIIDEYCLYEHHIEFINTLKLSHDTTILEESGKFNLDILKKRYRSTKVKLLHRISEDIPPITSITINDIFEIGYEESIRRYPFHHKFITEVFSDRFPLQEFHDPYANVSFF